MIDPFRQAAARVSTKTRSTVVGQSRGGGERRQRAWLTRWGYLFPLSRHRVRCGTFIY
jgi:hypothetical protein